MFGTLLFVEFSGLAANEYPGGKTSVMFVCAKHAAVVTTSSVNIRKNAFGFILKSHFCSGGL